MDRLSAYRFQHGHSWEFKMARALKPFGVLVALHKHYPAHELINFFQEGTTDNVFYTSGATGADAEKLAFVKAQVPLTKISFTGCRPMRQ